MRLIYAICLCMVLAIPGVLSQTEDWHTEAEQAYLTGNYAQAIELYTWALEQGFTVSEVYFNLGNAYYADGNLGMALLNYLRAQHSNPRDLTIDTNIMRTRAIRANYQGSSQHWIDFIAESTYTLFRIEELATITAIAWAMWFSLLAIYFIRRGWWLRWGLSFSGLFIAVLVILFFCRTYADTQRPQAVITDLVTGVQSGPSEDYLTLFELYNGAEIRIIAREGGWAKFILPDGRQGWITRFAFEYVNQ